MTTKDSLERFDNVDAKGFYIHDVFGSIAQASDRDNIEFEYETLAFSLYAPSYDNPWGTYYGPMSVFPNEKGEMICNPPLEKITPDAISYWEKRSIDSKNPFLKMHYAGIVWEFKKKITGQNNTGDNYKTYVNSMIDVCNSDYAPHPTETVNILERAFQITKNDSTNLIRVKTAFQHFEDRHTKDDTVRYWGAHFMLMAENKKLFTTDEINELIRTNEERLTRLSQPNSEGVINPWLVMAQAEILAFYYNKGQNKEYVERVLTIAMNSFVVSKQTMSGLQYVGNLELLHKLFLQYSIHNKASQISQIIQQEGENVKKDMKPFSMTFDIPKEVFDEIDTLFGKSVETNEERWNNFAYHYIPIKAKEEIQLKELVKKYPLKFMMGTKIMDEKGHLLSTIGSYESDEEGNIILHMSQNLQLNSIFLQMGISKLKEVGLLNPTLIINELIQQSPLFEKNRIEIIKTALELFVSEDYCACCHLLVPQIENAICNLVEASGEAILKPQKKDFNKGFQLKTLDELLHSKSVNDILTPDGALYLRLVLTDQRALNIRNLLCHGLASPSYFGEAAANRLFHVLVMLALVRDQPESQNEC